MPFLILSRQGLADLQAAGPIRDALWFNPGLLSDSEIAQLRREGVTLNVLPQQIAATSAAQRDAAANSLAGNATLWVEHAGADAATSTFRRTLQKAQDIAQERAEKLARVAARRIRRYAAGDSVAIIVPYMSYGSADCLTLRGRVLKDEGFRPPDPAHSGLRNLVELYKRLGSDEVPGATLQASFGGIEQTIVTDDSGYFHAAIRLPQPLASGGWHTVRLRLQNPAPRTGPPAEAEARVLAADPGALIIRTSAFFGPWDRHNFAFRLIERLKRGEHIDDVSDRAIISPTYVPDLVHATLDLLLDRETGIRHLANAGEVSWHDLARSLAERTGHDPRRIVAIPVPASNTSLSSAHGLALRPLEIALDDFITHSHPLAELA